MALSRFLAAVIAGVMLIGLPVQADEIQDINLQFRKGELTAALDRANRYLANKPKDAQALFLKGLILGDLGKTNDAIDVFKSLTENYPELPEPYNNLAVLYASQATSGEMMMKARILPKPSQTIGAPDCDFATVAPTRPPTSACDDDDGMP